MNINRKPIWIYIMWNTLQWIQKKKKTLFIIKPLTLRAVIVFNVLHEFEVMTPQTWYKLVNFEIRIETERLKLLILFHIVSFTSFITKFIVIYQVLLSNTIEKINKEELFCQKIVNFTLILKNSYHLCHFQHGLT